SGTTTPERGWSTRPRQTAASSKDQNCPTTAVPTTASASTRTSARPQPIALSSATSLPPWTLPTCSRTRSGGHSEQREPAGPVVGLHYRKTQVRLREARPRRVDLDQCERRQHASVQADRRLPVQPLPRLASHQPVGKTVEGRQNPPLVQFREGAR